MRTRSRAPATGVEDATTFARKYKSQLVRMRGAGASKWVALGDVSSVMPLNLIVPQGAQKVTFVQKFVAVAVLRSWVELQERKTGLELGRFIEWIDEQEKTK